MQGLGILILIVLFLWLFWPPISRWLKRKAMLKAEAYVRSKMGMPPPPPHERKEKKGSRNRQQPKPHEPLIPKEYAEDVEYTETIEYSETQIGEKTKTTVKYTESQISDAEWTEIKNK